MKRISSNFIFTEKNLYSKILYIYWRVGGRRGGGEEKRGEKHHTIGTDKGAVPDREYRLDL